MKVDYCDILCTPNEAQKMLNNNKFKSLHLLPQNTKDNSKNSLYKLNNSEKN